MKNQFKLTGIIFFILACIIQLKLEATETGAFSKSMQFKNEQRLVYFYVPEDYDETRSYPLVVGMESWYTSEDRMRDQLLPIANYFKFILACPADPLWCGDILPDCIEFCKNQYNIDSTNVVVTGVAEGGTNVFIWGVNNPWVVKGIIGYDPWIAAVDYSLVNNRPFAAIRGKNSGQSSGTKFVMRDIKQNGGDTMYIEKENIRNENDAYYRSPEFIEDYKKCYSFIQNFIPKPQVKLISPANISYGPKEPITLKWKSLTSANRYEILVQNVNNNILKKDTINDTTYVLSRIDSGEYYYWRVRDISNNIAGEYSHKWSFRTKTRLPDIPESNFPEDGQINVSIYTQLIWDYSPRAEFFHVQVSSDDFNSLDYNDSNISYLENYFFHNKPFEIATTYKWKVRAGNIEGWTEWSDVFSFTTNVPTPVLIAPISDTTGIPVTGKFKWNSIKNITNYHLQLSRSNDFFENIIDKSDIKDTSLVYNYLDNSSKYYWRVRAKTESGVYGLWSVVNTFTTEAPLDSPIQKAPKSYLTNVPDSVEFVWYKLPNATSYTLQLSQSENLSTKYLEINQSNIADTFYFHNKLLKNSQYFWRIKAKVGSKETPWSSIWSFSTKDAPQLETPRLISPPNDKDNVLTNGIMSWSSVPEATSYNVQVALNSIFMPIVSNMEGITNLNTSYESLSEGKEYFWRVKALKGTNSSQWSEIWKFSTIQPLSPPEISNLENNQTNVPINGIFTWIGIHGADSYGLQLSNNDQFSENSNLVINNRVIMDDFLEYANLEYQTKYWIRLNQKQGQRDSPWSMPMSFTTSSYSDVPAYNHDGQIFLECYPNPANKVANLEFYLSIPNAVSLKVFNVFGTEVANLLKSINLAEGKYSTQWNVTSIPTGVYLIRLTVGSYVKYLKIVVKN
jgi:hypothetical protein